MNSKQVWGFVAIVGVLGLCACSILVFFLVGSGSQFLDRFASGGIAEVITQVIPATQISIPTTDSTPPSPEATTPGESTALPIETIPLDPDIVAQMEKIEAQVMQLRGLRSTGPVDRTLYSPDELYQHVLNEFLDDYTEEEATDDALVLALFGLLEPDFDLFNFYLDLYSEQIAGFYDDEVKKMYVIQEAGFGGLERITYAHEFVHALQDQIWGFDQGLDFNDDSCEIDTERCAAISALVEGDATLLEEEWLLNHATRTDMTQILEFYETYESPVYDSAPNFMQQDFLFPYTYGTDFVRSIHNQGGWDAVDAVYSDPPITTEQILHPERYPWDKPIAIDPPDFVPVLGEPWREIESYVLGEWFTQIVLSEQVGYDISIVAAQGWGGDVYVALANDDEQLGALFLMTIWDSVRDAQEFAAAFLDYGDARFGRRDVSTGSFTWESSEGAVLFEQIGNQTLWILAPDANTVGNIRGAAEFPLGN